MYSRGGWGRSTAETNRVTLGRYGMAVESAETAAASALDVADDSYGKACAVGV